MSKTASLTSTESFAARAQRSEAQRVTLWAFTLSGVLLLTVARRLAGGVVMSADRVFWPTVTVIGVAIIAQLPLWAMLRRANRASTLLAPAVWRISAVFDLCVPMALLLIGGVYSPRGAIAALSAPSLLLLPLVVLLSVLRLRPLFTLGIGLFAAAFHVGLAARAIAVTDAAGDPVYFAYAFLLGLTAVAGMIVAREVRRHVEEAVEEASAREQAGQRIAGMQRDMNIARSIQMGLLPAGDPDVAGFDIAGWSRPADQTGGDYYDWQTLADGRVIISIADATGHGIGPALVSSVCRAYARAAVEGNGDAGSLLSRLNQLLSTDLPADRFVTFAGVVLRPGTGEAEIFSAGHGPLLLHRTASTERPDAPAGWDDTLESHGPPFAVVHDFSFEPPTQFLLHTDDLLVLATDGAFEWDNGTGEQFGIERLKGVIAAHAGKPSRQIIREIDIALGKYANGMAQQDDVTLVVIKRTAASTAETNERTLNDPAADARGVNLVFQTDRN